MAKKISAPTMEKIAREVGGEVYYGYSGRCMFGRKCVGVVCNDVKKCISVARRFGLREDPSSDNMGLQMIVYWPTVNVLDPEGPEEFRQRNALADFFPDPG